MYAACCAQPFARQVLCAVDPHHVQVPAGKVMAVVFGVATDSCALVGAVGVGAGASAGTAAPLAVAFPTPRSNSGSSNLVSRSLRVRIASAARVPA